MTPAHANPGSREDIVFTATDITKTYQMGDISVHALRGVSLYLCKSEFVALLGPSGYGKSTLLHIRGGLDTPTGESVTTTAVITHNSVIGGMADRIVSLADGTVVK